MSEPEGEEREEKWLFLGSSGKKSLQMNSRVLLIVTDDVESLNFTFCLWQHRKIKAREKKNECESSQGDLLYLDDIKGHSGLSGSNFEWFIWMRVFLYLLIGCVTCMLNTGLDSDQLVLWYDTSTLSLVTDLGKSYQTSNTLRESVLIRVCVFIPGG